MKQYMLLISSKNDINIKTFFDDINCLLMKHKSHGLLNEIKEIMIDDFPIDRDFSYR